MTIGMLTGDLPRRLTKWLQEPLPGWRAQSAFQTEFGYGRYFVPAPASARPAAVLVLLYFDGQWKLPLTLRPREMGVHAGQISLPGGTIDADETGEQAALRELEEELGVPAAEVRILGELSPLYLFRTNFAIRPWLAVSETAPSWRVNPLEVATLLEVPLAALLDRNCRMVGQREQYGVRFRVPAFYFAGHEIWGATSMILAELLQIVAEAVAGDTQLFHQPGQRPSDCNARANCSGHARGRAARPCEKCHDCLGATAGVSKLEITTLESVAELRAGAAHWDDLWLRSDVKVPAMRAEAVALWLDFFAPGCCFRAVLVEADGRLIAALPLYARWRRRTAVWRLPGNFWSPAGDLLLDPQGDPDEALDCLIEALAKYPSLLFKFDAVVIDSPRWKSFLSALDRRKLAHASAERFKIPRVAIQGTWNDYLDSRSGNHRRHIRKALARARRRGELELEIHNPTRHDELVSLLREAFQIEDRCWKGKAGTSVLKTPGMFDFMVNQAELLADWGQLEILLLKLSGEPIAFEYGWTGKETYFSPKIGYDERFNDLTPGQLLRHCYYERLFVEGSIAEIDYLGPLTSATAKWATGNYTIGRLLIAPDRILSRTLVSSYLRLRPWIRRIKAKLKSKKDCCAAETTLGNSVVSQPTASERPAVADAEGQVVETTAS
jgi:8-oxo-dGTP pyrophosphatase MutT (NUDIX family)/CelD/BcsL family acetyltransferase involved in cellulose biosynthesis